MLKPTRPTRTQSSAIPSSKAQRPVRVRGSGQATTTVQRTNQEEQIYETSFPALRREGPTMEAEYSKHRTFNLGNYESIKVGCSIRMPCDMDEAALRRAMRWMESYAGEIIQEQQEEILRTT